MSVTPVLTRLMSSMLSRLIKLTLVIAHTVRVPILWETVLTLRVTQYFNKCPAPVVRKPGLISILSSISRRMNK